jgi:hypothetical protein
MIDKLVFLFLSRFKPFNFHGGCTGQVTRAFGSSLEVVVRISVAEVHSGTLRMAPGMATVFMVSLLLLLLMMMIFNDI